LLFHGEILAELAAIRVRSNIQTRAQQ